MTEVSMDIRKKNNRKNKILLLIFLFVIILSVGFPYCDLKYENRIIDNSYHKIFNFIDTWAKNVDGVKKVK